MPFLNGSGSTKLIRQYEGIQESLKLSEPAACLGRIPIFAVSASLLEDSREAYMATGFDGWIMKPIDFKRLSILMKGIYDRDTRDMCQYKKGEFESGGWFKSI
jgi:CheY-like chemotaxis protein